MAVPWNATGSIKMASTRASPHFFLPFLSSCTRVFSFERQKMRTAEACYCKTFATNAAFLFIIRFILYININMDETERSENFQHSKADIIFGIHISSIHISKGKKIVVIILT